MKRESEARIKKFFRRLPPRVFWPREISDLLTGGRREWEVTGSAPEILAFLTHEKLLIRREFKSARYSSIIRYSCGKHSSYTLALSLRRNSFLSHKTALMLHGMVPLEKVLYVNREQSPKGPPEDIRQSSVTAAFKNKQRLSKYVFSNSGTTYVLLNGKHTGRLGVVHVKAHTGEMVDVTDKERTLIDIVVRPAYAGGIEQVADIYAREGEEIDIDRMIDLLRRFGYVYPYHQAIGFLLERAGRSAADCRKFEELGKELDFYLDYGMKQSAFNKRWRIYYPPSLA